MVLTSKIILPVVIGISLCSVSAVILYILLKKEDDEIQSKNDEVETLKNSRKEKIVPKEMAAAIIGRNGSRIKEMEQKSGAKINITDSNDINERVCIIRGNQVAIELAENLLDDIIEQQNSIETSSVTVPHWAIGKVIGRSGENINRISRNSSAKIKVEGPKEDSEAAHQRVITIRGTPLQIKIAQDMIQQTVDEDKRNRETDGKMREPRGKHASPAKISDAPIGSDPGTKGSCPQNAPPAGSSGALLEVFVSAVSSPSRFWLQIVGPQVAELDKLVELMTEYYSHSDNRDMHKLANVHVGQIVAAVFRPDGKWYRAKVAMIKPNEFDDQQEVCDVHYVDYGDNEYVAKHELCSLRTDMLRLRFQAMECFLAGVAPVPQANDTGTQHMSRWNNLAIDRFEALTQVAQWKRLWSKTCTFKERPKSEITETERRNVREGSPIPGVKLFDTKNGRDIDIAQVLIDEGWGIEVTDQEYKPQPPSTPTSPPTPNLPPTFGDLESSRVLGMLIGNREERASSLPHGGTSPSSSPRPTTPYQDEASFSSLSDGGKPMSQSLASGMNNGRRTPSTPLSLSDLSYPKLETNGIEHMNESPDNDSKVSHQNGDFLNAERGKPRSKDTTPVKDVISKPHPLHIPDPKDELKAKMNRVDSHHASLEAMGKQHPPLTIVTSHEPQEDHTIMKTP